MRSIIGLVLLMTGLSIGAYAYYPETVRQHVSLANVTKVIAPVTTAELSAREVSRTGRPAHVQVVVSSPQGSQARAGKTLDVETGNLKSTGRNFSPGAWLSANTAVRSNTPDATKSTANTGSGASKITTAALPAARKSGAREPALQAVVPRKGWTAIVTPAISSRSGTSGNRPLRSSVPADGSARYALIRDIQRELKRVGCYWGKIDGSWGAGSKRAIAGFVKSVNSTLPTRSPDYILLALVRTQPGMVCGVARDRAIVASTDATIQRTVAGGARAVAGEVRTTPRLVARPRAANRGAKTVASVSKVDPVVAPKPVLATNRQVTRVLPKPAAQHRQAASRRAVTQGRMAVGGPKPHKVAARATAPGVSSLPPVTRANVKKRSNRKAKPAEAARLKAPAPRPRLKAAKVKRKKYKKVARASAKQKKRKKRRSYRRRRGRNPLRNLLTQGVH